MPITVSVTESDILTALRTFLLAILPSGIEVIKGEINRVPEPEGPDFVVMTPMGRVRIETNTDTWDEVDPDPTVISSLAPTQMRVQVDVHGPNSGDNSQIITTLFRDDYACQSFAASGFDVQPLYCSDPTQQPFLNAEQAYEYRWVIDLLLQANPVVQVPQEFADVLTVGLIDVDVVYPPGG